MIDTNKLQNGILAYLQASVALPGVKWRGSDNTTDIDLPMVVVHIPNVEEEWEDSGIYNCQVVLQIHTHAQDESGSIGSDRRKALVAAMDDHEALTSALDEDFAITAITFKGAPLQHKDLQIIHAARYELLLSENTIEPDEP